MLTKECIETRRSIRKFTDQKVDRETVEELVRLAGQSPSWKNTQVVRYYAVTDEALKNAIAEECTLGYEGNTRIIKGAPVLMVLTYKHGISGYEKSGEPSTSKGDHWEVFDAGIATQTFCLAARDLGLGTVIMGIFDESKVKAVLQPGEDETVAALVALGYPEGEPSARPRKEVAEILSWR